MKFTTSSLALLSAAALSTANPLLQHRAVCNADNCARAVTGTNAQPAAATRRADCSSFQLITVTPAPSTTTAIVSVPNPVTTTVFVGDTATANVKRQASGGAVTVSPSVVPSYAASCSGTSRYASACSCFGIIKTTTTAPTPTVTVTATSTGPIATATVVPGPRPVCGSTIQGTGPCACTYAVTCGQTFTGGRIITTVNTISEADCINTIDSYDNAFDGDYNRATGVCRVFGRATGTEAVADDDAFAFAGTCTSNGQNPQCVVG